jgi:hypothetical protein
MQALFDYGYQLARNGYPWKKLPPGLEGLEGAGTVQAAAIPDP